MAQKFDVSLEELESFDPQSPQRQGERRFCCPWCGVSKPRDAAHRCLCLNTHSGLWHCKRNGEKGLLREFAQSQRATDHEARNQIRQAQNYRLQRAFGAVTQAISPASTCSRARASQITEVQSQGLEKTSDAQARQAGQEMPTRADTAFDWQAMWENAEPIFGSPGEKYLQGRVPITKSWQEMVASHLRFTRDWYGRATLVFALHDREQQLVGVSGRCLKDGKLDKPAAGAKKQGIFRAVIPGYDPFDRRLPGIVICEAPLDALSMAVAGFPALALCGTSPAPWLARACAFRRVYVALDADDSGDNASLKLQHQLQSFGCEAQRLRPEGAKDWNQMLQLQSKEQLADWLAAHILQS